MIIGIVLPSLPGYSETFFKNKIVGLQQNGIRVILFVNDSVNQSDFLNCKVINGRTLKRDKTLVIAWVFKVLFSILFRFPKKNWQLYKLNKKDRISFGQNCKSIVLNQFLLSEKLDWLHFGFGTMVLGRENIAEVIGAKMAVSFRGFDHYVYPVKNKNCYKLLFSKEVKYHVLSEGMRNSLIDNGVSSEYIEKISPAIDVNLFSNSVKTENGSVVQILTVARLHWIKGLDYTLQALAQLRDKGQKFHYTIIGDGAEKERLVFAVNQLGLTDYVTFAGKLFSEDIKIQLQKTDLYLQYSNQEGFCNAVLEAQAMGKICIVSDADGLVENIINEVTGFVVEKRNPKLLSEKIREVIMMSFQSKQQIEMNAIERIKNQFSLEGQKEKFVSFYILD